MSDDFNSQLEAQDDSNLRAAASLAATNLLFAQRELGLRLVDPTITTRALLDIADHSYKVSGMAKKQEIKDEGTKVVFNIIMGGGDAIKIEKDVVGEVVENTPEALAEDAYRLVSSDTLKLDFANAPEFSSARYEDSTD